MTYRIESLLYTSSELCSAVTNTAQAIAPAGLRSCVVHVPLKLAGFCLLVLAAVCYWKSRIAAQTLKTRRDLSPQGVQHDHQHARQRRREYVNARGEWVGCRPNYRCVGRP